MHSTIAVLSVLVPLVLAGRLIDFKKTDEKCDCEKLREDLEVLKETFNNFKQEYIIERKENGGKINDKLSVFGKTVSGIDDSVNHLKGDIIGIRSQVDANNQAIIGNQRTIDKVKDNLTAITKDVSNKVNSEDQAIDSLFGYRASIIDNAKSIAAISSKIENKILPDVEKSKQDIIGIRSQVNSNNQTINWNQKTINNVKDNVITINQDISNIGHKVDSEEQAIKNIQKIVPDVKKSKQDIIGIRSQVNSNNQTINGNQRTINNVKDNLNTITKDVSNIGHKVDSEEKAIKNVQKIVPDVEKSKQDITRIRSIYQTMEREIKDIAMTGTLVYVGQGWFNHHDDYKSTHLPLAECIKWCMNIRKVEGGEWNGVFHNPSGDNLCFCMKNGRNIEMDSGTHAYKWVN